ncbi:MAG TPA: amidohydrolase family protein [Candidatus Binatia bacterium]|jgi:N-acyl-D-aspartate/D-glutamate deacylase|nr:amidohydrolase family protein [Candidatus Binatia bacterium]
MYDLLIENARICNGTGKPSFYGSVAVKDGLIAAVGKGNGEAAAKKINADGLALAPGFIDPHTHYDAQVAWDPLVTCSSWHGITTVVMGNCGVGVAPVRPKAHDIVMWDLVNVEAIPFEVMQRGINWQWETHAQYLDALQKRGLGINVASLAALTPLRHYVMGEESFERAATDEEIEGMQKLFREAMRAGAFGLTTTILNNHIGYQGRPLACRNASRAELSALCQVLRQEGRGAVEIALTGTNVGFVSDDEYDLLEFLVNESQRPVTFLALFNKPGKPDSYLGAVEKIKPILAWNKAVPQVTCRPLRIQFNMRNPFLFAIFTAWHGVFNKSAEEQMQIYADPGFRQVFREEMDRRRIFAGQWGRMTIIDAKTPEVQAHVASKKTVAQIARDQGKDPIDAFLDLAIADRLEVLFDLQAFNFEHEGVKNLVSDTRFLIGLSDGGAHVDMLCDAGYATYLLGRWVREHQVLTLEEGVRRLTSVPADFFGIPKRGRIAPGLVADLTLFDPDTVDAKDPEYVWDLPGGGKRFVAKAKGIKTTVVSGQILYQDGEHQGGLPGKVLRSYDA